MEDTPPFFWPIRIYYEDTDAGGVVYYANYLRFLERCRTEWLRQTGIEQAALLQNPGIAFVVRNVNIDYLKPARLDDALEVTLSVTRIARSQLFFEQTIVRPHPDKTSTPELLIRASVQLVCVNAAKMTVASIPLDLKKQLETIV